METGEDVVRLDRTKLLAARYRAAQDRPYLAAALYSLTVVETRQVPTMGVDRRWRCYVSPEFVARTPVPELAGVWVHEVSHLLRDHHGRSDRLPAAEQRDHMRVNIAQDCEINDDILADGLPLPEGTMSPQRFGMPEGLMFEAYLRLLPEDVRSHDCGSGAHGVGRPWEEPGPAGGVGDVEAGALRRSTAEAMRSHQRTRGSLPGGWKRWAEEILQPTVDWRRVLAGAVREALAWAGGAVDYTYARPSRRSGAMRGVILPSLRRPMPRVAVVVDTSGSMSEDDLAAALAEVSGVLKEVGVGKERVAVLSCDADVQVVRRVTSADQVELLGGGGTDMRVGIEAALRAPQRPQVVIVLTDGYTPWPSEPSAARVVAALIGDAPPDPPPWIEKVYVTG
ncbi:DUF2201 family putative metallopeptidase [Nocardiopsis changdeensis]|uniref:vWA domain-containing protein n=1 Tax=Nocardiopsis TaxID=2013 RepID=UPI0021072758|nr:MULTISPECIES: VWA-like domain-containing protein [Nocardiopsis]